MDRQGKGERLDETKVEKNYKRPKENPPIEKIRKDTNQGVKKTTK